MQKITSEDMAFLYCVKKVSPEKIAQMIGCSGRTVRNKLSNQGIKLLGANHLRKGISATWNKGIKKSQESIEKMRKSKIGSIPHNKNQGLLQFTCKNCGLENIDKPYRRSKFCNRHCRDEYSKKNRGENHWNYKNVDIASNQRKRLWAECIEWRKKVINRDKNTCQKCKNKGGILTAHHIDSWATHPNVRFEVNNGATLCYQCHRSFHSVYGQKHNTRSMFEEWITK